MKRIIFIIGESGCGKSTLQNRLIDEFPDAYTRIISSTSRVPRVDEKDGIAYHFKSREGFEKLIKEDEFLQYTEFGGNFYGTEINEYNKDQDYGLFVCTPIGVTDTINALRKKGLEKEFRFTIIFFMTTKGLLKKHDIPMERINRGNILKDFNEMYIENKFDDIDIEILMDRDVNSSLYKIVDKKIRDPR